LFCRSMLGRIGGLSTFMALVCAACSSGGGDAPKAEPLPDPVPEAEYAARYAAVFCNNVCCERAGLKSAGSSCVTQLANTMAAEVAEVRENLAYDEMAAGRCLADLERGLKTCADPFEQAAACDGVYSGKLVLGSACEDTRECAAPKGQTVSCQNKKCQLSTSTPSTDEAAEGESCESRECQSGLTCHPRNFQCVIGGRDGDYCVNDGACEKGLVCDSLSATCRPSESGGRCTSSAECAAESEYCDPCTARCVPKLADGKACTATEQCLNGRCYPSGCSSEIFGVDFLRPPACVFDESRQPTEETKCPDTLPLSDEFSWEEASVGSIWEVWGSAADDVFAHAGSTLFHTDGTGTWEVVKLPLNVQVEGVWGRSKGEYYLATNKGLYEKTPTSDFTLVDLKLTTVTNQAAIKTLTGGPGGTVYATTTATLNDYLLTRSAEGTWLQEPLPLGAYQVRSLHVSAAGDVFALADLALAARYEGAWSLLPITGSSVSGVGNDVYLATTAGLVKAAGQDRFERVELPLTTYDKTQAVFVRDSTAMFVATSTRVSGEYRILFGDGAEWSQIGTGTSVNSIWAASRDDVYIGTQRGILRGRRK